MWKQSEDTQLLELWPDFSASEISVKLGRSRNAIIGRFHRLNKTYADAIEARLRRQCDQSSEKLKARRSREATIIARMKLRIAGGADRNVEICEAHAAGAGQPAIGDAFGITRQAISLIVKQIKICEVIESV